MEPHSLQVMNFQLRTLWRLCDFSGTQCNQLCDSLVGMCAQDIATRYGSLVILCKRVFLCAFLCAKDQCVVVFFLTRFHVMRSETEGRLDSILPKQPLLTGQSCLPCHSGLRVHIILEILCLHRREELRSRYVNEQVLCKRCTKRID